MDRLDLELYADRLARHADRLADDVAAARLRLSFAEIEHQARLVLGATDTATLEAIGVMAEPPGRESGADMVTRRRHQLEAVGRFQCYIEERLVAMRGGVADPMPLGN